ncbi:FtsP/CotA-like multicopper oxidase with cupredoxin domain [Actinomycetospora succinea]|uniref:Multicopper oxidase CueO n=1 Tax=Actinomycetospora succinea TaxID=663603 RepID=A0A4V3D8H4_9PSEU|nr:multicopper oxidase domain-containing protein [Actinomycetospora succinea]TDQ51777.1 FtsP/CotA-like multicopper oxidase with cupredoxin domain [Actinomycetospora succinea]
MTLSRRRFLGATLAAGALTALAACSSGAPPVVRRPAQRPLAIPPLAPVRDGVVELTAAPGESAFLDGPTTPTWGYGGMPFGGPTIRARRGEEVVVRVTNRLPETTTTHWHGMTLPARMDGGPHQPIAPGETWEARWRVDQPAATLWYHPHPHGATERHVHRGLAGLLLVDDDVPVDLPDRYGLDDVPVILTDRSFGPDGSFDTAHRNAVGLLGDTVLVNGTVAPYLDVRTTRVRLRVLNASPARSYRLAVDAPMTLVGTDGGLLPSPHVVPDVALTPGERAEIVVDVAPGRRVMVRSVPDDLGAVNGIATAAGGADTLDLLELRPADRLEASSPVPAVLSREVPLSSGVSPRVRRFELSNNRINGRAMDMSRVDEVLEPGATEIWELVNRHTLPHNIHVHDARLQVIAPGERAWKDTVPVPPGQTVRVLVRVGPYADPEVPYMIHCHMLRHEDDGMMLQFLVVGAGQRPAAMVGHAHG